MTCFYRYTLSLFQWELRNETGLTGGMFFFSLSEVRDKLCLQDIGDGLPLLNSSKFSGHRSIFRLFKPNLLDCFSLNCSHMQANNV